VRTRTTEVLFWVLMSDWKADLSLFSVWFLVIMQIA